MSYTVSGDVEMDESYLDHPMSTAPCRMPEAHEARSLRKNILCAELQGSVSAIGFFWDIPQRKAVLDKLLPEVLLPRLADSGYLPSLRG